MKTPVPMAVRSHAGVPASAASNNFATGPWRPVSLSPTRYCRALDQDGEAVICSISARAVFRLSPNLPERLERVSGKQRSAPSVSRR
jgi:hypothetical protein